MCLILKYLLYPIIIKSNFYMVENNFAKLAPLEVNCNIANLCGGIAKYLLLTRCSMLWLQSVYLFKSFCSKIKSPCDNKSAMSCSNHQFSKTCLTLLEPKNTSNHCQIILWTFFRLKMQSRPVSNCCRMKIWKWKTESSREKMEKTEGSGSITSMPKKHLKLSVCRGFTGRKLRLLLDSCVSCNSPYYS